MYIYIYIYIMTEIIYNNKDHDRDANNISFAIERYRDKDCKDSSHLPTCRIDDRKIRNISYFFTSVITKCPATNITLNDIRQLKIIGRGTYGYGISLPNKIVKIIICEQSLKKKLYEEIEYNKIITNSKNEHFIKLLGYFVREVNNEKNEYNYYNNIDNFTNKLCITKDINLDKLCEIYLILEKADKGELRTFYISISKIVLSRKINELLNMYTINKYFIDKYKNIFVHGDIKTDNIVVMMDEKFKIIDFGLSSQSKTFFFKSPYNLTYYNILYGTIFSDVDNSKLYLSPFYDIFCILYVFWVLYYAPYFPNALLIYQKISDDRKLETLDKYILSNKYLYILSYEIHMFFYNLYNYFTDKNLFNNFVDIKMVKYIYINIFMINDLPQYIDTNNKLLDDYNYYNNIMTHMLTLSTLYPKINRINVIDILISYILENNYSDIELFNLMKNVTDKKIIESIILNFNDNNFLDEDKNNLLYYAINKNLSIDIIQKLIAKNINMNNINNKLDIPLSFAIKNKKSLELIKLLINNNSDIHFIDINEESIFHLLLKYGYNEIIKIMIDKFVYFNIRDINDNNELQHGIIKKLPQNIIEILIDKVNINNINKDGYNSLHLAIHYQYSNIVTKLLQKNIGINTDINNIKSTLYLCLEYHILNETILSPILEKTVINKSISLSPINIAIKKHISLKLIDKMIDIFDINQIDDTQSSCLLILCTYCTDHNNSFDEYFKLIEKVIIRDNDINRYNSNNTNPLVCCITNNFINIDNKIKLINLFINNNADLICKSLKKSLLILGIQTKLPNNIVYKFINNITINNTDENKENALYYAIKYNYDIAIIKKLIDTGINIKQLSITSMSPLSTALYYKKDIDIIKLLIHKDIINIYNNHNIYPIDTAIETKNINIIGLLLLNDSLLTTKSIDNILIKFTESECIELFRLSTYIKNNLLYFIDHLKKYKLIDKKANNNLYKKTKHLYKFLLTLKN